MVCSSVKLHKGILAPTWSIEVELLGQLAEEEQHGLVIGVSLEQGEVAVPSVVDGSDDSNPRLHFDQGL